MLYIWVRDMRPTIILSVAIVASMLFVATASADEFPVNPEEIAPEGEPPEECPVLTEAVNPFSNIQWNEYTSCQGNIIEYQQRERTANNIGWLIDKKEAIQDRVSIV